MKAADADILIVPGWSGSGAEHWQTRWEARLSTARRVAQDDWERPSLEAWTRRLVDEVTAAAKPVVLVAHSLGVTTVLHAAPLFPKGKVAGAFLAAPPSRAFLEGASGIDPAFADMPEERLPFPAILAVSSNDEHCAYDEALRLARAWGAEVAEAGEAGHINAASGHGPWPEGLMRFAGFMSRL